MGVQGIPRHQAVVMLDEVGKEIEDLGFEVQWRPRMAEFVALCIKLVAAKNIDH
jgi:hypothetical protein